MWRDEFGDNWNVPDMIDQHPKLVDISWHNDASPSFQPKGLQDYEDVEMRLWVQHPDPEQRETDPGTGRYRRAVTLSGKGPFEKSYGGELDRWPLDALTETAMPTPVDRYPYQFPTMEPGPVAIGHSIDTLTYDVPEIAAAVRAGTLTDVSDEFAICFAPSEGDGVTAEIFRLWDAAPGVAIRRFTVTDAGNDFRVLFSSDTDAVEAIRVLHVAQSATRAASDEACEDILGELWMAEAQRHTPDLRDVVSRALSVIELSDGADEHAELLAELRGALNHLGRTK